MFGLFEIKNTHVGWYVHIELFYCAPHGHKNHIDSYLQDPHMATLPCSLH